MANVDRDADAAGSEGGGADVLRALAEELLSAAVVAEREQGLSPARIQELTGRRPWNEAVLQWTRDGRRNAAA
ncbi:hypothetical protein AB0A76_26575 [Streptomyces exfoliatus]|uniref:Uncharacterized protein n=1 Tax=Streptomyces exfoliatus TaxID=1905 RepID=A0ABV3D2P5_STREX